MPRTPKTIFSREMSKKSQEKHNLSLVSLHIAAFKLTFIHRCHEKQIRFMPRYDFRFFFTLIMVWLLSFLKKKSNKIFCSISFIHSYWLFSQKHLISPRSTGSASSGNSLYKRKYSPHIDQRDALNQSSLLAVNAKRFAYHTNSASMLYCIYCTKNDFENLEQLHAHVQQMHAIVLREVSNVNAVHVERHWLTEFDMQ